MENNENFVGQTENVENPTEQTPKMFTQEEVNEIVGKSKARERAKIEKQYQREYGELMDVLEAGTGKKGVGEVKSTFLDFYAQKGITPTKKPELSDRDVEVLALADVDEIIRSGFEDVEDEADRLNKTSEEKLTAREKAVRNALNRHIQETATRRELAKIGVTEDVYNSAGFKEYASMFNHNIPITKVYEEYRKSQPKTEHKSMGSMKSNVPDTGLKEFYSYEEASKFSKEDFDKNPALYKRVVESMTKWK